MPKNSQRQFCKSYPLPSYVITLILSLGIFYDVSVNSQELDFTNSLSNTITIAQASNSQNKVRIAVLDFDYSSVGNPSFLSYFSGGAVGISDLLVNELVKSGQYSVIERSQIEAILKEQNLAASGRVDASTAASIGRLLGVEKVILGSVTQLDLQRKESGGGFFGTGADVTKVEAYVQLNARLIDTTTGEILTVVEGQGHESQKDTNVSVLGIGGGSSTQNEGKLITEAAQEAVGQLVGAINSSSLAKGSQGLPAINAVIADISGNIVILNKGTGSGYRTGMKVSIERVSKEIKDPETGEVIRTLTEKIGQIELTDVDAKSSVGRVISGTNFEVGDIAKPTN